MGSVFSPTYFSARGRRLQTPAEDFCAVNAVVYRRGRSAWCFTEPPAHSIERRANTFALSGSRMERTHDELLVSLDERTAPWGGRVRGRVRISISAGSPEPYLLDRAGDHRWWPIGARARAEVELERPALRFRGSAYHDCNFGRVPLEATFACWNWSRTDLGDDVGILYDAIELTGASGPLALRIGEDGVQDLNAPVPCPLPPARWGMPRQTRSQGAEGARILRNLEDTPFYTRSLLETSFDGHWVPAVHESLSLSRFVQPWVQRLLPFRLRRGWRA